MGSVGGGRGGAAVTVRLCGFPGCQKLAQGYYCPEHRELADRRKAEKGKKQKTEQKTEQKGRSRQSQGQCPYQRDCGGCAYLDLTYEEQLEKARRAGNRLADTLLLAQKVRQSR